MSSTLLEDLAQIGELADKALLRRLEPILMGELSVSKNANTKKELPKRIQGGINLTQVRVLLAIEDARLAPIGPTLIAERTKLEQSRVSHQVKLLINKRLVQRLPGPTKRQKLALTPKGQSLAFELRNEMRRAEIAVDKKMVKQLIEFRKILSELRLRIANL